MAGWVKIIGVLGTDELLHQAYRRQMKLFFTLFTCLIPLLLGSGIRAETASDIVAWYTFDKVENIVEGKEPKKQWIPNTIGHGKGLLLAGFEKDAVLVEGRVGKALDFNSRLAVAQGYLGLRRGEYPEITVEFWAVRLAYDGPGEAPDERSAPRMVCFGGSWHGNAFVTDGDKNISLEVRDKDGNRAGVSAPLPPAGGWHHYLGLRDDKTKEARLYIDGRCAAKTASPQPVYIEKNRIAVGNHYFLDKVRPFRGYIDELRVLTRALTDTEIEERARQGKTSP